MLAAALITFREGLEAALVVSIVLGSLQRLGHEVRQRRVWWGVLAAVFASLALGLGVQAIGGSLRGLG
ncbi:MAG: FTR1 family protein [Anaerolineae bacterium]|jgi:high-affinity iron transporter